MLLNGRHEIYENSEAVSSFTDVPFPHHHKKRPPVHWCKQRKKKGKQNGRGHWRGWLQYKQLLYIWSNSKVLLFFPDTLVHIQGEKPYLRFHCHCALWVMSCPSCPRLDPQADQGSRACTALKLYNYQLLQGFSHDFCNTHSCSEHRSQALNYIESFSPLLFFPWLLFISILFPSFLNATITWIS